MKSDVQYPPSNTFTIPEIGNRLVADGEAEGGNMPRLYLCLSCIARNELSLDHVEMRDGKPRFSADDANEIYLEFVTKNHVQSLRRSALE